MQVRWSPEAADNLVEIYEHLLLADSPFSASTVEKIYEAVSSLAEFPYRGRLGRITGTRELVLALPYTVVYRVQNDAAQIVSIRHQARLPVSE